MKDVSAMENEELLDAYDALDWNEHQFKTSSAHVAQYNLARAELLRRLSAPVQPGPRPAIPRCPKCGAGQDKLALDYRKPITPQDDTSGPYVYCEGCKTKTFTEMWRLWEIAAFFPVPAPSAMEVDEKRLTEIRKRLSKVAEGPWFTSSDDARDSPDHKDSGLALVDTGRSSEWPIARLCEWQNARFIEHAILDIPYLLEQIESLRRRVPQPVTPEPSKRLTKKQGRAARRREKRAVLAAMPYRDASEWAEGMVTVKELVIGPIRSNEWQVVFCGYEFPAHKDKAMVDRHADDLRRALRRKLRYYGAQEKRALCAVFGQRQKEGREILRPEILATTQGTPEGAKVISATRIVKQEDIGKGGTKKLLDQPDF